MAPHLENTHTCCWGQNPIREYFHAEVRGEMERRESGVPSADELPNAGRFTLTHNSALIKQPYVR